MGYVGPERTTRRAIAEAKRRRRVEHGRRTRPWVVEPGLGMQWYYCDGPKVAGRTTVLFCAWLAWSRFRVVLPLWDRTMASVVMGLVRALRAFGGAPTYAPTDNEHRRHRFLPAWRRRPPARGGAPGLTRAARQWGEKMGVVGENRWLGAPGENPDGRCQTSRPTRRAVDTPTRGGYSRPNGP
jgi:hypothetical protein